MRRAGAIRRHVPPVMALAVLIGGCDRQSSRPSAKPAVASAPTAAAAPTPAPVPAASPVDSATRSPVGNPTTSAGEFFAPPWVEAVGIIQGVKNRIKRAYDAVKAAPNDAAKIGELGMFYYDVAAPMAASTCFVRCTELEPSSARWWYLLALSREAAYERSSALEAAERAVALAKDYCPAAILRAELLLNVEPAQSKAAFERVVASCPDDARGPLGLGRCEELANRPSAAVEWYRRAVKSSPDYAEAHRALARLLTGPSEEREARQHAAAAQKGDSPPPLDDPYRLEMLCKASEGGSLVTMAKRLTNAGRRDQAIYVLKQVLNRGLEVGEAHNTLGMVFYFQKRLEDSAAEFRKAVEQNPLEVSYKSNFAQMQIELGRYPEGEQALRKVLDAAPGDLVTLGRYGRLLLALGRADEAAGVFEEQLKLQPNEPEFHFYKLVATVCLRRFQDAVDAYKQMKRRLPPDQYGEALLRSELVRCLESQKTYRARTGRQGPGALTNEDLEGFARALEAAGQIAEAGATRTLTQNPPDAPPP